ncbi:ATV_HP_G0159080.mRNA.1.CDS.1 [Saccharomyces cerevisiae]|nr:ATV_HP_G0159080.mRNA.1.CDS.1 [Saccharomyces cerevisiae]CAI6938421.1 ATV_HP_G0159080.mRNA.1.CDS.1 [Saccharomyces cerevisiae]
MEKILKKFDPYFREAAYSQELSARINYQMKMPYETNKLVDQVYLSCLLRNLSLLCPVGRSKIGPASTTGCRSA